MRNARFWILGRNSNPVKLTLRPGQSLAHYTFTRTDEGYSATFERYTHEGKHVLCQWENDGRDCDGHSTREGESMSPLGMLRDGWKDDTDSTVIYPAWQQVSESQRDEYAEAMGY